MRVLPSHVTKRRGRGAAEETRERGRAAQPRQPPVEILPPVNRQSSDRV